MVDGSRPLRRAREGAGDVGQRDLQQQLDDARRLQAISTDLIEKEDLQGLCAQVLDAAAEIMGAGCASIQMVVREQQAIRLLASKGFARESVQAWRVMRVGGASVCARALGSGARVIIPDVERDAALDVSGELEYLRASGIRAVQSSPLVSRSGRLVGVLSTHWHEVHTPTARELRDFDVLVRLAADLIDRAMVQDALQRSQALLQGQRNALDASLHGEPLARTGGILLACATQYLDGAGDGARASLWMVRGGREALQLVASSGSHGERGGEILGQAGSMGDALAMHAGEAVVCADVEADPVWAARLHGARACGCRAVWSFPVTIMSGDRPKVVAAVDVAFPSPRSASSSELEIMSALTNVAGVIIAHERAAEERDRAEQALRAGRERQAFLLKLMDAVRSLASEREVLATAGRLLRRELGADRVVFWETVKCEPGLVVAAEDATSGVEPLPPHVDGLQDFAPRDGDDRRALIVQRDDVQGDAALDPGQKRAYAELGIGSCLAASVSKRNGTVGWVSAQYAGTHAWSALERGLLIEVAERSWEAALRARAEEALRMADRRKDEFLAILSHELRNPLTALRTTVQYLRQGAAREEDWAWAMDVIDRQSGQMSRLVEDLLDVSRIAREKMALRMERVELGDVVRTALETCRPYFEECGHVVSVVMPDEAVVIGGDPARLAQVFSNLLHNAGKFSPRGGRVSVYAALDGRDVVVSVRDSGIGIAKHMLGRVFELFHQVDSPAHGGRGGLGIGLSLVKRLVELHGGTVEALSEGLGHGSEFVVRLPLRAEGMSLPAHERGVMVTAPARRRVLIVDDNADTAVGLAKVLDALGYETSTESSGRAALVRLDEFRPAAAIVHLCMPEVSGCALAEHIRGQAWGRDVMLIAITGWESADDRSRSRAAGFDHHMVKPIDFERLARLLAEAGMDAMHGPPSSH